MEWWGGNVEDMRLSVAGHEVDSLDPESEIMFGGSVQPCAPMAPGQTLDLGSTPGRAPAPRPVYGSGMWTVLR